MARRLDGATSLAARPSARASSVFPRSEDHGGAIPLPRKATHSPDGILTCLRRKNSVQSVLTGNTRPSAQIKLSTFGLDAHLDLDAAAYGTDSDQRADLVRIARQRAAEHTGHTFGPDSTVLIGDTPADVAAAQDGAARIIAVATGDFTADDLAAAGATTVLADLTSTTALMAALYPGEPAQ